MSKKILLFTLQTFSTTGGIQKMTRTLGYSLYRLAENNKWNFKMLSYYDADSDQMPQYLPVENFKGFNTKRVAFMARAAKEGATSHMVILSHINLSIVGLMIKKLNPKCKIWLIAHGIEVWRPLSIWKNMLLGRCDKIICVSNFTRQQIVSRHKVNAKICTVLNNAVDPFMNLPLTFTKPDKLLKKYNLTVANPVIFTLTRLAATEQYKGHDQVISVISRLTPKFPNVKYILSGQYDENEETRIRELIKINRVENQVILTGFIDESELSDHFLLADLFVLPSKKEGFGIVFIEALACGLPVICGNADGSIDAIRHGELGQAIDVENLDELYQTITDNLAEPLTTKKRKFLQKQCLKHFNEKDYMNNLEQLIVADRDMQNIKMNTY